MTTREDLQGCEYDWLAVDAGGHVGFFSTAGGGYAPDALVEDPEGFDVTIRAILELPAVSAVTCDLEVGPGCTNTWRLVAERGLFAFDSDPNGGPYKLIAVPHTPIALARLPTAIRTVAARVALTDVQFRGTQSITEPQLRRALPPHPVPSDRI